MQFLIYIFLYTVTYWNKSIGHFYFNTTCSECKVMLINFLYFRIYSSRVQWIQESGTVVHIKTSFRGSCCLTFLMTACSVLNLLYIGHLTVSDTFVLIGKPPVNHHLWRIICLTGKRSTVTEEEQLHFGGNFLRVIPLFHRHLSKNG